MAPPNLSGGGGGSHRPFPTLRPAGADFNLICIQNAIDPPPHPPAAFPNLSRMSYRLVNLEFILFVLSTYSRVCTYILLQTYVMPPLR